MSKRVCVLGSGAWGTVIAGVLADKGNEVYIYGIVEEEVKRAIPSILLILATASYSESVRRIGSTLRLRFTRSATTRWYRLPSLSLWDAILPIIRRIS